ncbi:alpha/beta hydrolase [Sphingomonas sp. SUN019]|uniref:alpha/beta hydrolase n=1 Tax=Sphingomonas sp. SUN019 TaxID=2937788 RepID=UPI002164DAB9|nr:alpha/beta hydrolase [Sphingomonas sp. SUN019]UVO50767.1 alpha/beta hydrolase [Sphingomonas sp. SUN019]
MREELYRSDDLLVRRVGSAGGTIVVTFASFTNTPDLDRPGFGEEFLEREGIDAIHVVNRLNRWYQHRDIPDMLAAIAAVTRDYDRVITYGSSMGGYAALRFARSLGADTAIALSPQHSVDPRVVPWETRWQPDIAQIEFDEIPFAPAPRQYVFYDPHDIPDDRHVALIAAAGPVARIPLPHAGHPVGALLTETGALQWALRAIAAGTFDPAEVRSKVRAGRRQSQHLYYTLAHRAAVRRPRLAITLLRKAIAITPESHIVSAMAVQMDRLGRREQAARLHERAVLLTPSNSFAWMAYAAHLEQIGDPQGASDALKAGSPGQSSSPLLLLRIQQLRTFLRRRNLHWLDRWFEALIRRMHGSRYEAAIMRQLGRWFG